MHKVYREFLPRINKLDMWETTKLVENYLSCRRVPGGLIMLNIVPASDSKKVWIDKVNTCFVPYVDFNMNDKDYVELRDWCDLTFSERMELHLANFNNKIDQIIRNAEIQAKEFTTNLSSMKFRVGVRPESDDIYILQNQHEVDIYNSHRVNTFSASVGDTVRLHHWKDALREWMMSELGLYDM